MEDLATLYYGARLEVNVSDIHSILYLQAWLYDRLGHGLGTGREF
jgi:hypothetical protein